MGNTGTPRLFYLDNLRVLLTVLLVLHHTAIAYGAEGSWYSTDKPTDLTVASVVLTLFTAINQSFFLGLFFFLSGYFTPISYDRKGAGPFLRDRFIRLGIPLAVYLFGIGPAVVYSVAYASRMSFSEFYADNVLSLQLLNFGPMWFVETLLYLNVGYVIYRRLTADRPIVNVAAPFPQNRSILRWALALGLTAFLVRLLFPTGETLFKTGLQPGYFPAYLFMFFLGIIAYRRQWLERLTEQTARVWGRVTWIAIPLLPLLLIATGVLSGAPMHVEGGWHINALGYAFWEPFVAFGLSMWLLIRYRKRHNVTGRAHRFFSDNAYTVYIIHPPVVILMTELLRGSGWPQFIKFLLAGSGGVLLCFALAWLIRQVPGAKRIL